MIEFVHVGKGKVVLNGVETPMRSGDFFLYGPGVEPHRKTYPDNPLLKFSNWRLLIFGLALILMMRFRPEGLLPSARMQQELHETKPELATAK